jgi:hypothetical protein
MIKEVTGVEILTDKGHQVYKPKKGQLQRLLKLGAHAPSSTTQGPSQSPSSPHGPSSSQGPLSSCGPPHAPKKKGILSFISQGLFACFNVGRHNAQEIHAHRKYVDEHLLKMEEQQKLLWQRMTCLILLFALLWISLLPQCSTILGRRLTAYL